MKPVAIAIIFKRVEGHIRIMTQTRFVQNKAYDPLYDLTHEGVGETLEKTPDGWPKETFLAAAIRGIREECGLPTFAPVAIYGANLQQLDYHTISGEKGDAYFAFDPFRYVQSLGAPQPWHGPVFVIEAKNDFEPDYEKADKEAGEHRWWSPEELRRALKNDPDKFMGLHRPGLLFFLEAVLDHGKLS